MHSTAADDELIRRDVRRDGVTEMRSRRASTWVPAPFTSDADEALVHEFWNCFSERFTWTLLPYDFLWSLYCAWMPTAHPGETTLTATRFKTVIRHIVEGSKRWRHSHNGQTYVGRRMSKPEPLADWYRLDRWTSHGRRSRIKDSECGITRI